MAKKTTSGDLFMQFVDISVDLEAPDPRVLASAAHRTGLSIRGALIWLVHKVEFYLGGNFSAAGIVTAAVSTIEGLAAMPELSDKGCLAKGSKNFALVTTGAAFLLEPLILNYLPPIPIAAPALHIYAVCNNNITIDPARIDARICFTTTPLDAEVYTEIAETWGW